MEDLTKLSSFPRRCLLKIWKKQYMRTIIQLKLFLSLNVKNNKQIEKLHALANLQGKTHPKTRYIDSLS